MWIYEKKLQYPVKIKNPNPKLASAIISQLGGPDGELAASMRYLHQRYGMPYNEVVGILTDVGTEELAHLEMIAAIIYQLTRNISVDNIKGTMFEPYYVDHTTGLYPIAASGGTVIIPVSKVSVGIASGGVDYNGKDQAPAMRQNFGGGGGTGLTISPMGFLVCNKDGEVEFINANAKFKPDPIDQITDFMEKTPDIIAKLKDIFTKEEE